jgi:hypothetical protein
MTKNGINGPSPDNPEPHGNATFDHSVAMRFLDCRVSGYSAAFG